MTNEQLALRVKAGIDPAENMLALYNKNTGLIKKFAKKYGSLADQEDLMQEGYIGLCNAVNGYDPDKGAFTTYAGQHIRAAMFRYIDSSGIIRIPVHMCQLIREYYRACDTLYQESGRKPSDDEIRQFMGLTVKKYGTLKTGLHMRSLDSLDRPLKSDEDEKITIYDTIKGGQDPGEIVADQRQGEELEDVLWTMVDQLTEDKGQLIRLRYKDGLQIREIADRNRISFWQADNRIRRGIRDLRKPNFVKKLRPFLPDRFQGAAYHGSLRRFNETWTSSTEAIAIKMKES